VRSTGLLPSFKKKYPIAFYIVVSKSNKSEKEIGVMSRYTMVETKSAPRGTRNGSSVTAKKTATSVTGNGAPGFDYKDKSALFLLGVSNFTGQDKFYESGEESDSRFVKLIRSVAKKDPAWVANFLSWLRSEGNIRTASIIGAIEYGRVVSDEFMGVQVTSLGKSATVQAKKEFLESVPTPRSVLASVLQRADEPSEALGYWLSTYGKKTPKWLKRGLGDAAKRLYTERSVFKYDSQASKIRFADVVHLSSVKTDGYKSDVFDWIEDRRYNAVDLAKYPSLVMLESRNDVDSVPAGDRAKFLENNPEIVEKAGYSWESLAGWLNGPLNAKFWESLIPNMGYMALIRNLRNFAKAGISQSVANLVAERIADPEEVAKSRQLPLRFLSAYRAIHVSKEDTDQNRNYYRQFGQGYNYTSHVGIDEIFLTEKGRAYTRLWAPALSEALNLSLVNVPELDGQTIILSDCSGSMGATISEKSTVSYFENAAAFAVALALKNPNSVLYGYADSEKEIELVRGGSLLDNIALFIKQAPTGGTNTIGSTKKVLRENPYAKRIVIVTDEQTSGYYSNSLDTAVPEKVTAVTFNVGGYAVGHAPAGRDNFHSVTGLNDSGFQMLKMIETVGEGMWPWESQD
jgi:hypothetical protein